MQRIDKHLLREIFVNQYRSNTVPVVNNGNKNNIPTFQLQAVKQRGYVTHENDMVDRLISNINRTASLDSKHTFACARRAQVSLTLELLNVFHRTTSCPLHYDFVHEAREERSTKHT